MTGLTGAQVAKRMLDSNGLSNVRVEEVNGFLSDNYDPSQKVLRLSPDVYSSNSLSAAGVAAHEVGHALQDQEGYFPLRLRAAMVPAVNIGSMLGWVFIIVGLLINFTGLAWLGVFFFGLGALFALATLPVELNASARANPKLPPKRT